MPERTGDHSSEVHSVAPNVRPEAPVVHSRAGGLVCECGHMESEHTRFWSAEQSGMGCDHCDCDNPRKDDPDVR